MTSIAQNRRRWNPHGGNWRDFPASRPTARYGSRPPNGTIAAETRSKGGTRDLVLCYAQTNIGSGRDNNEDNYYCNGTFKRDPAIPVAEAAAEQESRRLIYGVFDGMGGEANGEQAALLCAQTLHQCSSDEPFDALDFFRRANVAVCDMIAASGQIGGSTAATVHLTGNRAYCCNVGDSRIYLQRGGALQRISRDHTKYQEQLDAGAAAADAADNRQARAHAVSGHAGRASAQCRISRPACRSPWATGCCCCTDGLTGKLSDSQLQAALGADLPLPELGQALMAQALAAGPGDNITLVLIEITALDAETAVPLPRSRRPGNCRRRGGLKCTGRTDRRAGDPAQKARARAPRADHPDRGRRAGCARRRDRGAVARGRQHPAQAPCPGVHAGADRGPHADAREREPAADHSAPAADAGAGTHPRDYAGAVARHDTCPRPPRTGKLTRLTRSARMRIIAL
ncbi:MAG: PP2C family protein-serine/threonine phosphatase [Oscillospiraceae bacterium]